MVRRKCCYPHFLFQKKCLGMFKKHSWQEILHDERVNPSLTAQKNIFSSDLWQRQGSFRVNVQPAMALLLQRVERAGWFGSRTKVCEWAPTSRAAGAPTHQSSPWKDSSVTSATRLPLGCCWSGDRAVGTLAAPCWTQSQRASVTVLWPGSRNVDVCRVNHITGGMFSHSKV